MKFRTLAAAAALTSLVATPVVAADRDAAPVSGESEIGGGSWLIGILAAAAFIFAIVIAVDSGNEDDPVSV